MRIETERLVIRSIERGDEIVFAQMAADGSLNDIGFDANCGEWMGGWIEEACSLTEKDDPKEDYIACTVCLKETNEIIGSVGCSYYEDLDEVGITYFIGSAYRGKAYAAESVNAYREYFFSHYPLQKLIAAIRDANPASWKTAEKGAFTLKEIKMYQDIDDEEEQLYRFYEAKA